MQRNKQLTYATNRMCHAFVFDLLNKLTNQTVFRRLLHWGWWLNYKPQCVIAQLVMCFAATGLWLRFKRRYLFHKKQNTTNKTKQLALTWLVGFQTKTNKRNFCIEYFRSVSYHDIDIEASFKSIVLPFQST